MEYSYNDGGLYYFMDQETYELVPINETDLGDNFKFVKENMMCKVLSYKGNVFGVEPPTFVELKVTQTDPGFAGNTATNATKPATLETGAEIRVPLFINEGDMIRIDTRTGEDIEDACSDMAEQIDAVDEDLADVEEEFYGDCDCDDCCDDYDDDDCCYEVECPNCNDVIYLDEGMIEEGGIKCPNCGTELEFDLDDCDCDCCDHAEDCE